MQNHSDTSTENVILIGAGGVSSYLIPALRKSFQGRIFVIDGDILEERNLDRQLFPEFQIGKNKATALSELFPNIEPIEQYFTAALTLPENVKAIFCAVDNHPARKAALEAADRENVPLICGANQTLDSEAYIYFPEWKKTKADPRVRYPEILTEKSGDPISCQGDEAIEAFPQLPVANMNAAAKMLHLYWVWLGDEGQKNKYHPFELMTTEYANHHLSHDS